MPLAEGIAPQLITPATFAAVQRQLGVNKSQATRNNRNPEALLRAGFATCGYCGGALIGRWNTRRGEAEGQPFYECAVANRTAHGHPAFRISATLLDAEVEARLMMVLEDEAFVRLFIEPQLHDNAIPLHVAELEAANDGRKSDLDKLPQTLEIAQRHADELDYHGKREWLEALSFRVRVWATDHAPRWEITSSIDPSFWELDLEEADYRPWPEAEAMAERIYAHIVVPTRRWSNGAGHWAMCRSCSTRRTARG